MTPDHSPADDDRTARTPPPVAWWHTWQRLATETTRATLETQAAVARGSVELWRGTVLGAFDAYEESAPEAYPGAGESRAALRRSVEEAMDAFAAAYAESPTAFAADVTRGVEQVESLTATQRAALESMTAAMLRLRERSGPVTERVERDRRLGEDR